MDGSQIGSGTYSSIPDSSANFAVGVNPDMSGGVTWPFNGYIDEVRVTKGIQRYTGSTYTVPTAAFPDQ